jgi:hypothetical protein
VDPDRVEFLFGRPLPGTDLADEHTRWELLRADRPAGERMLAVRTVLAAQILADDPPDVWWTARRLLAVGRDRHDVMDELARALLPVLDRSVGDGHPLDTAGYRARLAALPRSADVVAGEIQADVVRRYGVITAEELHEHTGALLGRDPDDRDEIAVAWWGVHDLDRDIPHRRVEPGLVVHAPTLAAAAVLTRRLTDEERVTARLRVDTDLAAFLRVPWPRLDDEPIRIRDDTDRRVWWWHPRDQPTAHEPWPWEEPVRPVAWPDWGIDDLPPAAVLAVSTTAAAAT